jgi:hypothetical protein
VFRCGGSESGPCVTGNDNDRDDLVFNTRYASDACCQGEGRGAGT